MTINLINDLNFAQKLNACEAVTESGKECLKNYRGYCFNNYVTCGLVNNFIKEAQNYSYDSGMMSILESVKSYILENNISWKLASVCEALSSNNSQYGFVARAGVAKVEKLLEMQMKESEVIGYIKAGALRDVQFIPEFRAICKEVYGKAVNESKSTVAYRMSVPVSYVVSEDNNTVVSVNGQIFSINEGGVEKMASYGNEKFNRINGHLANMKLVDESLVYAYRNTYLGDENKFTVTEEKIDFTNGKISESFTDPNRLREWADTFSRTMNMTEQRHFNNVANAIAEVFESMDNIMFVDNVKMFNCVNGASVAVIESAAGVNVTLFNGYGSVNESNGYKLMSEAVKVLKQSYNIDALEIYANKLNEEKKDDLKSKIEEHHDEIAIRRLKIAELCEQHKDDPVKLAILEKLNSELNKLK